MGCSPWGREESDTAERLHFPLSSIGEGNGNPLQCSCLENPRDGGAWWAAVYGVAQSRTRVKRLSSSSPGSRGGCGCVRSNGVSFSSTALHKAAAKDWGEGTAGGGRLAGGRVSSQDQVAPPDSLHLDTRD